MNLRALNKFIFGLLIIIICLSNQSKINPRIANGQSFRVGIQPGHWPNESGALSCDRKTTEAEINLAVAEKIKVILEKQNIIVDILEGTANSVHNYSASAFVSLHTDYCAGSNSGFKVSRWKGNPGTGIDGSGDSSDILVQSLWSEYAAATNLPKDTSIGHFTPCFMTYYALNPVEWGPICIGNGENWTQIRGISDNTPGAIIEMGWLSGDLKYMTSQDGQTEMATGISNGILNFLGLQSTIPPTNSTTSTVLVFDISGSMGEIDSSGLTKIEAARRAGDQIVNVISAENVALGTSSQIGIASYETKASVVTSLTADMSSIQSGLNSLSPTGRTAMADGLKTGLDLFSSTQDKKVLILLSDGLPNVALNTGANGNINVIKQEVIDLATQAGQNNICVYTVGFGDPALGAGSIDEDFLREVASASGCGSYYNAQDAISLANIYVELRHSSTGTIVFNQSGTISQGQQLDLGAIEIPTNQELMLLTLNWPGSKLEPVLKDPSGKTVDENYPGVSISTSPTLVSIIMNNPVQGSWQLGVVGVSVPEGTTQYNTIMSTRAGTVVTPPPVSGGSFPFVILILAMAGGGIGVYVYSNSLKRTGRRTVPTGSARAVLVGTGGMYANQTIVLRDGLVIGRGSTSGLRLNDRTVSRTHARFRFAQNTWFIQDMESGSGTFVNGQRVDAVRLNPGDQIRIGTSTFTFSTGVK